jgi:forespore regulator of the sigma-K checkpoint
MKVVVFSLWKRLKKRLRMKRRWWSLGFLLLLVLTGFAVIHGLDRDDEYAVMTRIVSEPELLSGSAPAPENAGRGEEVPWLTKLKQEHGTREVWLRKVYVCGEETASLGLMNGSEIDRLFQEHAEWTIDRRDDGSVVFTEYVNDLSPACKESAYFGIDQDGNLTLFQGLPAEENIIRTFFQLDIQYLESSLPRETVRQLYEGIRIRDVEEFNSVLSTFSTFADEKEK